MIERRTPTLLGLDTRLRLLEDRAIKDDGLHQALISADSQTARAVEKLTEAINDPRDGLIVQLDRFRTEVANDRKVFRAWVAGAVAVLSAFSVVSPWIRDLIITAMGMQTP